MLVQGSAYAQEVLIPLLRRSITAFEGPAQASQLSARSSNKHSCGKEDRKHLQIWPIGNGAGFHHRPPPACMHVQKVYKANAEDYGHDGRRDLDAVELDPRC